MPQKIKPILLIIIVLVLVGILGYFSWQYYSKIAKEGKPAASATPDLASVIQTAKDSLCSGGQKFLDESMQEDTFSQDFFVKEQVENFRDYYFCQGLFKNNEESACSKEMYLSAVESEQCKNGFYFSAMILASLLGEKDRALEICQNNMNIGPLCNYITDLDELVTKDACSQLVDSGQKTLCYAIFNGEEKYCSNFEADIKEACLAQSKFLKIIKEGDKNTCDSLLLREGTTEPISSGAVRRAVVACKLYFNNSAQTCDAQYAQIAQSVCGGT